MEKERNKKNEERKTGKRRGLEKGAERRKGCNVSDGVVTIQDSERRCSPTERKTPRSIRIFTSATTQSPAYPTNWLPDYSNNPPFNLERSDFLLRNEYHRTVVGRKEEPRE